MFSIRHNCFSAIDLVWLLMIHRESSSTAVLLTYSCPSLAIIDSLANCLKPPIQFELQPPHSTNLHGRSSIVYRLKICSSRRFLWLKISCSLMASPCRNGKTCPYVQALMQKRTGYQQIFHFDGKTWFHPRTLVGKVYYCTQVSFLVEQYLYC